MVEKGIEQVTVRLYVQEVRNEYQRHKSSNSDYASVVKSDE
jgi:hypothetical protein